MKKKGSKPTTIDKGRIVEKIVALLHEQPGISVSRNVMMQTTDGQDRREIDVLISGRLVGYNVQLAVECKNYKMPIGKEDIDAFVGKLRDLGFPTQYGIYVSSSRYTKGAVKRAKNAGLRILKLEGLTKDRLTEAMYDALQSIIYLLPIMTSLTFFNDAPEMTPQEMSELFNDSGEKLNFFDLIWRHWCDGKYPKEIGTHTIEVDVPNGFTQYCKGKRLDKLNVAMTIQVVAVVVQIPGKAKDIQLTNDGLNKIEKRSVKVSFDDENVSSFATGIFESREDLDAFLNSRPEKYKLVLGHLLLPKILTPGRVLWPPSQQYMNNITRLRQELGSNVEIEKIDMLALHGGNFFEALFDEVWEGHPASRKPEKPRENGDDAREGTHNSVDSTRLETVQKKKGP